MLNRLFRCLTLALFIAAGVAVGCSEPTVSTKPGTYKTEGLKTPEQKNTSVTETVGGGGAPPPKK